MMVALIATLYVIVLVVGVSQGSKHAATVQQVSSTVIPLDRLAPLVLQPTIPIDHLDTATIHKGSTLGRWGAELAYGTITGVYPSWTALERAVTIFKFARPFSPSRFIFHIIYIFVIVVDAVICMNAFQSLVRSLYHHEITIRLAMRGRRLMLIGPRLEEGYFLELWALLLHLLQLCLCSNQHLVQFILIHSHVQPRLQTLLQLFYYVGFLPNLFHLLDITHFIEVVLAVRPGHFA